MFNNVCLLDWIKNLMIGGRAILGSDVSPTVTQPRAGHGTYDQELFSYHHHHPLENYLYNSTSSAE